MAREPQDPAALAASRLPDVPDAGYSTARQRATSDLIVYWCREIERRRHLLLAIVVDGPDKFKKIAGEVWHLHRAGRSTALTSELLNRIWDYMLLLAGPNPARQLLQLEQQVAQQALWRSWDQRASTQRALEQDMRQAMGDLLRDQRRLSSRHSVS